MEGIEFHDILANVVSGKTDAKSSSPTSPSLQRDAPVIAPYLVEEYVPLFGAKPVSVAEKSSRYTEQNPPVFVQGVASSTAVPKEIINTVESTSLISQDKGTNPRGASDSLPVASNGFPAKPNVEAYQPSTHFDGDDSVFAESAERWTPNDTEEPISITDLIQLMQEGNRKKYPLREVNRDTFRGSGWEDTDISGDYDPNIGSRKYPSQNIKPQRQIRREDGDDKSVSNRQRHRVLTYEQGRKTGKSIITKLRFLSESHLGNFRKLAEEHDSTSSHIIGISEKDGNSEDLFNGRSTGTRTRTKQNISCGPDESYEHLLGHREARGCKACYGLGIECTLVDDGRSYPCHNCREDGNDCVLLIPPQFKRACERCKRKRTGCSYSQGGGVAVVACKKCHDANVECIAGPAKSFRIDDVLGSVGSKSHSRPAAKRKPPLQKPSLQNAAPSAVTRLNVYRGGSLTTSAVPLSVARSTSSLEVPRLRDPFNKQALHKSKQRGKGTANSKAIFPYGQGATKRKALATKSHRKPRSGISKRPHKPVTDPELEGGKFLYIDTSYCHPIELNWIPPPPLGPFCSSASLLGDHPQTGSSLQLSSFPCHFCTDPGLTYALAGLGKRRIEVIQWEYDPSLGYEELEGGWTELGEEKTRMCMKCTMERMVICLCEGHVIRPIDGLDPKNFNYDAAMRGLVSKMMGLEVEEGAEEEGAITPEYEVKWCSICIFPAFYECCTRPMFSVSGTPTSSTDDIGCGLLLCEVCASRLMGSNDPDYYRPPRPRQSTAPRAWETTGEIKETEKKKKSSKAGINTEVSLDAHIITAGKDYFNYPDGLRADVCFLSSTGEVMRRLGSGPETSYPAPESISLVKAGGGATHGSDHHREEVRPTNPLYETLGRNGQVIKKADYGEPGDFKSTMYANSDDSDGNSGPNPNRSPGAKKKRYLAAQKVSPGRKGRPRARTRGRRNHTGGGGDVAPSIKRWGSSGYVDLT